MDGTREISCIIPFWNEGSNLISVLTEITKAKNISEIICVDDGSDDCNHVKVKNKFPAINLVRLQSNRGKTDAVREGLKHAKGEFILLLDADLKNLDHREIDLAAVAFFRAGNLDMLILRRINAVFYVRLYRADILFTGERILKKGDLVTILDGDVNGWQLESAINTWMYLNGKNVSWVAHSGINCDKQAKWGTLNGIRLNLRTYSDMVSAAGFNNIMKQIFFFARSELRLQ
jgi:glycosyltransferase involved in cell wall biosynthesis